MAPNQDRLILRNEVTYFLVDRTARRRSPNTIRFYHVELGYFLEWLAQNGLQYVSEVTPGVIRSYLVDLGTHRNRGGVHSSYRAIRAFFRWASDEYGLDPNPIDRVQIDSPRRDPLPGVPLTSVKRMVGTCGKGPLGLRDRALLWFLVDSGVRMAELVALNLGDVDLGTGAVVVRHGKGDRLRTTFVGASVRRELTRYLRTRGDLGPGDPLFTTDEGSRLTPSGLRQIVRRRAKDAGVPEPGLHDFRRTFALESLRNGCDMYSLMRLMGHSSPAALQRYLALVQDDLKKAHAGSSPVDRL